jgi:hypothetical protein
MLKTICIDFDGVISDYRGWEGKGNFGNPIKGSVGMINELFSEGWKIIIYTTRSETEKIEEYLNSYGIHYDFINYNPENVKLDLSPYKPIADIYLDDRAVRFEGEWDADLMQKIKESKPHWRK